MSKISEKTAPFKGTFMLSSDGTRVRHDGLELRQCPLEATKGKILFCSRDGKFFSRRTIADGATAFNEIKHCYSPANQRINPHNHGSYPHMPHFGNQCHTLIAVTWIGPRPDGMEIDHINGDRMNWSADNLQYVTPAENRRRAKILRALRAAGTDPKTLSTGRLINIFNRFDIIDGAAFAAEEPHKHD